MKKLVINKEYYELLKENNLDPIYSQDAEIYYGAWRGLDIAKFRFLLHKIVELKDFEDKDILNKEISNNNFTPIIMLGILDIVKEG